MEISAYVLTHFLIVLGVIALAICIGIGAYFTYKYMNRNKENVSKYDYAYHAQNY